MRDRAAQSGEESVHSYSLLQVRKVHSISASAEASVDVETSLCCYRANLTSPHLQLLQRLDRVAQSKQRDLAYA
jgi:hypothetical protein